MFTGDKCYGKKQSMVRWGSGGQFETSLHPQPLCSRFLISDHKNFFSPSYTTNHCTIISLIPFTARLLQQVVYTLLLSYLSVSATLVSAPAFSLKLLLPKTPMLPNSMEMNQHLILSITPSCLSLGLHHTALSCLSSHFPESPLTAPTLLTIL